MTARFVALKLYHNYSNLTRFKKNDHKEKPYKTDSIKERRDRVVSADL